MDQDPLVMEQIDAGANFLREFAKHVTVLAAFWLKASEEHHWYLYVASDDVEGERLTLAYREVRRIAGEMRTPYLDLFRVKLIGRKDRVTEAVLQILQLYSGPIPIRLHRRNFGRISFEEIYIYPTPVAVS
jgi:hypothetical protein